MRLWLSCFAQAIRRDLQFRAQTCLHVCASLLELALSLIPVLLLTGDARAATAVVGAYGVCAGLIDCFIAPNLRRIDAYVRRGDLDLILVRPVNAQLYAALRWSEPSELGRVAAGAVLMQQAPSPGIIVGAVGFVLLWANLAYLAFWFDSAEPVNEIAVQVREAGKYPLNAYPRPLHCVLPLAVPMSGQLVPLWLGVVVVGAVAAATVLHWRAAIRRYDGASG